MVEPRLETYNINPDLISAKITPKTKAILVVHLYGQLAEMEAINNLADQHDLLVVEDAAQAHGASTQCSVFSAQSRMFSAHCRMLSSRCSLLCAQCSVLSAQKRTAV